MLNSGIKDELDNIYALKCIVWTKAFTLERTEVDLVWGRHYLVGYKISRAILLFNTTCSRNSLNTLNLYNLTNVLFKNQNFALLLLIKNVTDHTEPFLFLYCGNRID